MRGLVVSLIVALVITLLTQDVMAMIKTDKKCGREVLKLVNRYRKENGLRQLKMNKDARKRAEKHSKIMVKERRLFHSSSSVFKDHENVLLLSIRKGESRKDIASRMVELWKSSDGHNRNMLAADTKLAGMACVYDKTKATPWILYGTQIFWRKKH